MTNWSKPSGVDTPWTEPTGIASTGETFNLLQVNGDNLLQVNGDKLLIRVKSGFTKIIGSINTGWGKPSGVNTK